MTEKTEDLIAEAREQAAYLRGVSRDGSMPYSEAKAIEVRDAINDAGEWSEGTELATIMAQVVRLEDARDVICAAHPAEGVE